MKRLWCGLAPLWLAAAPMPVELRSFVDANCVQCHAGAKPAAGIDLKSLAFDPASSATTWVRVHDAVRDGVMPPRGASQPRPGDKSAFLRAVAGPLVEHDRQRTAAAGRSVLRRLNRYEYENTVRAVLGAPWLQLRDMLPEDGIAHRFNKSGEALDVSHVQMAQYLDTAEKALRLALAAGKEQPRTSKHYARDQKRMLNRMRYSSFNRHPERATIPILGFDAQPDVLAEKVPITVGPANAELRELEAFATPASTYVGNEYHFDQFAAAVGGRYKLRMNAFSLWIHTLYGPEGRKDRSAWWRPNREKTEHGRTVEPVTIYALSRGGEKRRLGSFDATPDPAVHELDIELLPGEMIQPDAARLFRSRPGFTGSPEASKDGMPGVAYRWMEIDGPLGAKPLEMPESAAGLETAMRHFAARAYRRPATEAEIRRYLAIAQTRLPDATEAAIAGYTAILCSPGFLYLEERPGALNGTAIANRLSYFLWNGPPDEALRKAGASESLRQPAVLRAQVDRMLDDPRSTDFINAFLDYWLDLRKLGDTTPDQTLYPDYYLDDLLLESARLETQLYFHGLVRGNRPAREIVDARYTIANSRLARHYGLPPVEGVTMRRVDLPASSPRGGLLTQASILKLTANGTTTSPVVRGAWMLERIMGTPPPPPPPGVPAVEPDTRGATTIRQQLDKHRSVPSCAACHAKIDPPGFALESFDIFGGWRDRYRSTSEGEPVKGLGKNGHDFTFRLSQPVDASGQLATGETFAGIVEFKKLLLRDERAIARNIANQWIVYATGSPAGFAGRAEVERILDRSAKDGYGLRTILREIAASDLFTRK